MTPSVKIEKQQPNIRKTRARIFAGVSLSGLFNCIIDSI